MLFRTKTPIRVKHKLVLKVYFSVAGETLSGEPLLGEAEGVGDLRMLMVNLPELLPSVSIVSKLLPIMGTDRRMSLSAAVSPNGCIYQDVSGPKPSCTEDRILTAHHIDEESMRKEGDSVVPVCACCYAIQDFPSCSFEEAFPPQSATTLETDSSNTVLSTTRKTPAADPRGGR